VIKLTIKVKAGFSGSTSDGIEPEILFSTNGLKILSGSNKFSGFDTADCSGERVEFLESMLVTVYFKSVGHN